MLQCLPLSTRNAVGDTYCALLPHHDVMLLGDGKHATPNTSADVASVHDGKESTHACRCATRGV
jgi:hypothetical protein